MCVRLRLTSETKKEKGREIDEVMDAWGGEKSSMDIQDVKMMCLPPITPHFSFIFFLISPSWAIREGKESFWAHSRIYKAQIKIFSPLGL